MLVANAIQMSYRPVLVYTRKSHRRLHSNELFACALKLFLFAPFMAAGGKL